MVFEVLGMNEFTKREFRVHREDSIRQNLEEQQHFRKEHK
jgi:hypothetical protein